MKPVPRKSHKQHIRLWFEFYKLALEDHQFAAQILGSRSFYEPWGEVAGISFDKWWTGHSSLFEDLQVRAVQGGGRNPLNLYLALPLGLGVKQAMAQAKELFMDKQKVLAARLGELQGKSSSVSAAKFHLTKGTELRDRTVDTMLRVYRDVYLPLGRPSIGEKFAQQVATYFETSRTKLAVHFLREVDRDHPSFPNQLRQLRHYIRRAEQLVEAAARGDFPGRTLQKPTMRAAREVK